MGTAPGYSWNKTVSNATLENVVVANPNSVTDDVIAVNLSCNTGAIVKNARVLSGGQILNRDYDGYTENIHVSNGGTFILRSANASAKDAYISSGGLGYCQYGATYTNVEIFDGGTFYQNRGTVNNMIVHAGGVVGGWNSPAGTVWNNLTAEDGASFTTYAGFVMMGNVNIAAGAWTNADAAHTVDGVLTDVTLAVNATFSTGVALKNVTWNGGNVNFFDVAVSGYTQNTNQGIVRSAGASVKDADVKAGALYIQAGAVGSNIRVSNGASLQVTNMAAGATLKDITVYAGGKLANSVKAVYENVDAQAGASWTLGANFTMKGDIDIAAGALTNDADAHATDGTIHDLDLGINGVFGQGITLSNFNQTGGAVNLVDGASIKTGTMAAGAYLLYLGGGGTVADYTMAGGTLHASNGGIVSGATLDTGAQMNISTGAFGYDLTLNGGLAAVRGETAYVSGATVNAGTFYIQSDGSAENVHVYTGGSMQFHHGKVNGLVIEAGGVVNKGWGGENTKVWENVTAKAGAAMTLDNFFVLKGDLNIAEGALTNDADAHAADGVLEDFDFGMTYGTIASGVTLSNFTQEAGTVDVNADAAVKTAALNAGTLNFNAGAAGADIEAMGGTLNVAATAELDGADIGGATVNVASGAVARNLEVNAGTLNVQAGADVDGVTYNGGAFNISSGATIRNLYKIAGGTVNMYGDAVVDGGVLEGGGYLQALAQNGASGAVIRNCELRGGAADAIIVRAGGNKVENIAVYGGALHVQSGALASDVDVYDGGTITTPDAGRGGATMENIRIHAGGTGVFAANAARAMNIDGLTMDEYAAATFSSANVADFNATGGEVTLIGQKNYVSGGGTLEDLTVLGNGYLYINDPYNAASGGAAYAQMVNRNMTVEAGAMVLMHGTNVCGSDAQVWGKYYVQNGATLSGGTIHDGGFVNTWQRSGYNDYGVRARIVGVTVSAGGSVSVDNTDVFDMTTEAGAFLSLDANAGIGGNANNIAAGTLKIDGAVDADAYTDENHVLRNVNVSAQTLNLRDGIALKDLAIGHAGRIYAYDTTIDGLDIEAPDQTNVGRLYLSSGAVVSGGRLNGTGTVNAVYMTDGAQFHDAHVSNGGIFMSANASMTDLDMMGGIVILRGEETYISGATLSGGVLHLQNGGDGDAITVAGGGLNASDTTFTNPAGKTEVINNVIMTAGSVRIGAGATVNKLKATGGTVIVTSNGTINVGDGGSVNDLQTAAGAKVNFVENKNVATFTGENTNIAEGTLYFFGSAVAGHAANGVIEGFNADGSTVGYKLSIGSGIVLKDAVGNNTAVRVSAFDGAVVSGITLRGGAIICVNGADARVYDATLTGEMATCNLNLSAGAYASNTVVQAGGKIQFQHADAKADNTTIMAGGSMVMTAAADTGDLVTLDFTGTTGNQRVYITNLANVKAETEIALKGVTAGNTYTIANTGATGKFVNCGEWGLYEDKVKAGETLTNAFTGMTYEFNAAGTAITVTGGFAPAAQAAAAKLADGATTLNGSDKAAKWTENTTYTANVFLADGMTAGNAWLDIDGFSASNANIYGAAKDQNFTGVVNIDAVKGTIKNLAAGAGLGGSVAGVKLTVEKDMKITGAVYAGGMGDVTGKTETLVEGGTFAGNVFAGALCNCAANNLSTSAGDIDLTVNDGTFTGNIYAGAAVKAGTATSVVHSAGDIALTLNGGSATKGSFCVYGGGYATGTAAGDLVYMAGNVDITINGGEWGTYLSGRGIFGGAYADTVHVATEDSYIRVTGGTMGNIYGGGWAQNNGFVHTGDVRITIAGDAEIDNVFGGGSYSSVSGGTTEVGSVTIRVEGGDVKNNIFACGQGENSKVYDFVEVTFAGSNDYVCNVYGYGAAASATTTDDRTLSFDGYTGTLSGNIGGFDAIEFAGDTAATLSGETIDNGEWAFDYTDRTLGADTAMLTFDNGSFAGDTVFVDLSNVDQVSTGWSIAAGLTAANATYNVGLATGNVENLALGEAIASGDYAGWGFTLDEGVLKFKNLA